MGQARSISTRTAVIGTGAFGRNHLRVYRELALSGHPVELVAAVDPSELARIAIAAEYGIPTSTSLSKNPSLPR